MFFFGAAVPPPVEDSRSSREGFVLDVVEGPAEGPAVGTEEIRSTSAERGFAENGAEESTFDWNPFAGDQISRDLPLALLYKSP